MSGNQITFPVRVAKAGPEFDARAMPKPFVFREQTYNTAGDTVCLVFVAEGFCKWLYKALCDDSKMILTGEHVGEKNRGHFVIDADGWPLVECGCNRVAEVIRDLLNKYRPELSRAEPGK